LQETPSNSDNPSPSVGKQVLIGILFGLVGFAANWFKLELYFNVDFLFGSIITMFALLNFGLLTGVTAALLAATCSLHHWNHPYVIIIFSAEALCTGLLYKKRNWSMVTANLAYWFSCGLLLIILSYQFMMGFSASSTLLIALKQGINGVFNTLIATALYIGYCHKNRRPGELPSLRQQIFVTIALCVVVPASICSLHHYPHNVGQRVGQA
jgi:hypothetical protein